MHNGMERGKRSTKEGLCLKIPGFFGIHKKCNEECITVTVLFRIFGEKRRWRGDESFGFESAPGLGQAS